MSRDVLLDTLAAAAAALEAGDPERAAEELGRAAAAACELEATGETLDSPSRQRALQLHAACELAADRVIDALGEAMDGAGRGARAWSAYRR
jgi:hypothetical protein